MNKYKVLTFIFMLLGVISSIAIMMIFGKTFSLVIAFFLIETPIVTAINYCLEYLETPDWATQEEED